jgi:pancreatic triacylglycerol lipase
LYNNASSNARLIGRQIGLFVNDMRRVFYAANPKDLKIHCLGHSLGAHVCSYASNAATIRFNRITGMDPAGPFFEDTDPIVRLDATDADFVDAIHTNGGTLVNLAFGIVMPVGHVDFYPNGGTFQPGCPGLTSIIGGLIGGADPTKDIGCSHNRAIRYLTESISSGCPFVGFMCDTMV